MRQQVADGAAMPRSRPGRRRPRSSLSADVLAVFFAAGATLALLAVAVPHGNGLAVLPSVVIGSLGYPMALFLLLAGRRLPSWVFHVLLATGTIMVTLGIGFGNGGGPDVAAAFFYVWVAAYAFAFFPWLPAAAHLALVATAYAVVLARTGDSGAPAEWVLLMGTALTVGLVVGLLSRELRQLATTDALTGLPNRHALEALLSRESARAKRTGHPLSVALIDLDDFKQLNDTAGHQAGDDHLRDLARSWAAVLRELDVVARFGGDEFVVLLPDTPAADAEAVLGRLAEAESCSWSAGIGQWEPDEPPEALLARADAALYEAKRQGRRQVVHARQVTAAMPTACVPAGRLPVVPRNDASPKVKMPPSDATSQ